MSSHRVLPPLQNIFPDFAKHHPNGTGNTPQLGKTMSQSHTGTIEHRAPQCQFNSSIASFSPSDTALPAAETHKGHRVNGVRVSRRRAYTLSDVFQDANLPPAPISAAAPTFDLHRSEDFASRSVSPGKVSPRNVCLCQPDPKVPRPRNSFILFRQHHQAEVAKLNPGLANPEISKIIGDYWRKATTETKETWKNLAEEEKARHQKQYPEYRYQPRRSGRISQSTASSVDADTDKCFKCGGHSINLHRPHSLRAGENLDMTQARPATSQVAKQSPPPTIALPHGNLTQYASSPSSASFAPNVTFAPSSFVSVPHSGAPRNGYLGSPLMSPEPKRRRFESGANLSHPPRHVSATAMNVTQYEAHKNLPRSASCMRPEHLFQPSVLAPTRPRIAMPQGALALAPIDVGKQSSQSKSVEAMVMSIAALKKVRTLAKISKPLPLCDSTLPLQEPRGAIVSVEGTDDDALKTVITHLRTRLQQDNDYQIKLYYGGTFLSKKDSPTFTEWLKVIQLWHNDIQDVKAFITSTAGPTPQTSPVSDVSPKTTAPESRAGYLDAESSNHEVREVANFSYGMTMNDEERDTTNANQPRKRKVSVSAPLKTRNLIPVAIIPRYQLTLTDIAASFVPISDGYSPVDHWQWMAATWRGIPGPDVTIVVRQHASDDSSEGSAKGSDVEVRLADFNTVIVRYDKGGKIAESSLRRVGFEIEEWLRGMQERCWQAAQKE